MKIALFVHTPAQAHLWSHIVPRLKDRGHKVKVLARDHRSTCELLNKYGIQYYAYGKASKTTYGKFLQLPLQFLKSFSCAKRFMPHILMGTGVIEAYASAFLRKPCIIFEDTEPTPSLERTQWKYFASVILTPSCFRKDLGKKQVRFDGYKELAYLHPNYFKPDPSIYDELGINGDEEYVILRFNAFDAVHDIGRHGFHLPNKYQLVKELQKYARVFISAEGSLPQDLESYTLPIPFHRIHHALYYAQLLVSDTQTLTTEAAILGTPAIRCNNFVGPKDMGNFIELEQKYDLIYCFREPEKAIQKAVELVQQADLKEQWTKKRQRLLGDKIDVTEFMVWFIENYPKSYGVVKGNLGIQERFR